MLLSTGQINWSLVTARLALPMGEASGEVAFAKLKFTAQSVNFGTLPAVEWTFYPLWRSASGEFSAMKRDKWQKLWYDKQVISKGLTLL